MELVLLVLVVAVGAAGYLGFRSSQASRRGEDAGAAARQALGVVGPPALAVAIAIVLLIAATVLTGYFFLMLLFDVFSGGDGGRSAGDLLRALFLLATASVGIAIALVWGVVRIWRNRRRRA